MEVYVSRKRLGALIKAMALVKPPKPKKSRRIMAPEPKPPAWPIRLEAIADGPESRLAVTMWTPEVRVEASLPAVVHEAGPEVNQCVEGAALLAALTTAGADSVLLVNPGKPDEDRLPWLGVTSGESRVELGAHDADMPDIKLPRSPVVVASSAAQLEPAIRSAMATVRKLADGPPSSITRAVVFEAAEGHLRLTSTDLHQLSRTRAGEVLPRYRKRQRFACVPQPVVKLLAKLLAWEPGTGIRIVLRAQKGERAEHVQWHADRWTLTLLEPTVGTQPKWDHVMPPTDLSHPAVTVDRAELLVALRRAAAVVPQVTGNPKRARVVLQHVATDPRALRIVARQYQPLDEVGHDICEARLPARAENAPAWEAIGINAVIAIRGLAIMRGDTIRIEQTPAAADEDPKALRFEGSGSVGPLYVLMPTERDKRDGE